MNMMFLLMISAPSFQASLGVIFVFANTLLHLCSSSTISSTVCLIVQHLVLFIHITYYSFGFVTPKATAVRSRSAFL